MGDVSIGPCRYLLPLPQNAKGGPNRGRLCCQRLYGIELDVYRSAPLTVPIP